MVISTVDLISNNLLYWRTD